MSRQRLRPGMIEATTQSCPHCHGTGLIRSEENLALSIIRQIEDEGVRGRSREVVVNCPVSVANFIVNQKRDHIANIEARFSLFVRINADTALVSPEYSIEKLKTSSRPLSEKQISTESSTAISASDVEMLDEIDSDALSSISERAKQEDDSKPKKRRRRRRRKPRTSSDEQDFAVNESTEQRSIDTSADSDSIFEEDSHVSTELDAAKTNLSNDELKAPAPKRKRTTRKVRKSDAKQDTSDKVNVMDDIEVTTTEVEASKNESDVKKPKAKTKPRGGKKATKEDIIIEDQVAIVESASAPKSDGSKKKEEKKDTRVSKPKSSRTKKATSSTDKSKNSDTEVKASVLDEQSEPVKEETKKTRRRGWWSKNS